MKKVMTIDLKPTPTGYAKTLIFLAREGNTEGKKWAEDELIRLVKAAATITPNAWATES